MIERLLFQALTAGIAQFQTSPDDVSELFQKQHALTKDEADKIQGLWESDVAETDERKYRLLPSVNHGYPHGDANFPGYFITLTGEQQTQRFLGDEVGQFLDDPADPDFGSYVDGAIWKHSYTILILAQHADVVLYLYQMAKAFITLQADFLKSCGILNLFFSGADMAPDPTWMPSGFYARRLTVEMESEYNLTVPDTEGRAWKVAGVHVDAQGAPGEDTGGVKTLVTIDEDPGG